MMRWGFKITFGKFKIPIAIFSGFENVNFLSKARNGMLNRKIIKWTSTDARLPIKEFYEADLNQQIAINELGGGKAYRDFLGHIGKVEELRHEEGTQVAVSELKNSNAWASHWAKLVWFNETLWKSG